MLNLSLFIVSSVIVETLPKYIDYPGIGYQIRKKDTEFKNLS